MALRNGRLSHSRSPSPSPLRDIQDLPESTFSSTVRISTDPFSPNFHYVPGNRKNTDDTSRKSLSDRRQRQSRPPDTQVQQPQPESPPPLYSDWSEATSPGIGVATPEAPHGIVSLNSGPMHPRCKQCGGYDAHVYLETGIGLMASGWRTRHADNCPRMGYIRDRRTRQISREALALEAEVPQEQQYQHPSPPRIRRTQAPLPGTPVTPVRPPHRGRQHPPPILRLEQRPFRDENNNGAGDPISPPARVQRRLFPEPMLVSPLYDDL